MCVKTKNWIPLSIVSDGEYLEVDGIDVWMCNWNQLDVGELEVPHPGYPQQSHTLWINHIESYGRNIIFAAGELSNGAWCFYVPQKGQPEVQSRGMTVNEMLYHSELHEAFDIAISSKNKGRAIDILILSGLSSIQANETVAIMCENSEKYGYK